MGTNNADLRIRHRRRRRLQAGASPGCIAVCDMMVDLGLQEQKSQLYSGESDEAEQRRPEQPRSTSPRRRPRRRRSV
jgi:hypothetical protein